MEIMDKNIGLKLILEQMQTAAEENNPKDMEILKNFFEKVYFSVYSIEEMYLGNAYDNCKQSFYYSIMGEGFRDEFLEQGKKALSRLTKNK